MWSDRWHVERGHHLLPTEIAELIPAIYSQEEEPDKMAYAMLFSPINGWRWFITEWEPREGNWLRPGFRVRARMGLFLARRTGQRPPSGHPCNCTLPGVQACAVKCPRPAPWVAETEGRCLIAPALRGVYTWNNVWGAIAPPSRTGWDVERWLPGHRARNFITTLYQGIGMVVPRYRGRVRLAA